MKRAILVACLVLLASCSGAPAATMAEATPAPTVPGRFEKVGEYREAFDFTLYAICDRERGALVYVLSGGAKRQLHVIPGGC